MRVAARAAEEGVAADAALLAACAAGAPGAAEAMIAQVSPGVLRLATRLLGDPAEAEDVTQETMMRLWRVAPDWRAGEARISTWTHRVASNLCLDRLRRRGRLAPVPVEEAPEPEDPAPSALETLEASERAAALEAALTALPERQRAALTLRHLEGWSNPAIGEALGVSVEAVESLLGRGRRALARRLAPKPEEER